MSTTEEMDLRVRAAVYDSVLSRTSWGLARGAILSPELTWRLAQAWHSADRRDPAWRRRTVEETEEVFRQLGLEGDFWKLR